MDELERFDEVWVVAFDHERPPGENPDPFRLRARELKTGRTLDLDREALRGARTPPFRDGVSPVLVAYGAPAALGCFLELGWGLPHSVLDLEAEFRNHLSGLNDANDWGFASAMRFYGACGPGGAAHFVRDTHDTREKEQEQEQDPANLERLLLRMLTHIDVDRALLRGRYTAAVARIERVGIPVDQDILTRLRASWGAVRRALIGQVDREYGVFEGGTFKEGRWADFVRARGIPWPIDRAGRPALDDDTFKRMAVAYAREVAPMWELRKTLSKLRVERLAVGNDGRNRTPLRPFASKTGRNQPSTSQFIYGGPAWIRGLIRPGPGTALAYVDYEQQEFGIAAALSGDEAMAAAYESGDPYLAFAKQAGAVPPEATKSTHRDARERFKLCALGIQYGMGQRALAALVGSSEDQARALIQHHKAVFSTYWRWSRATARAARRAGHMTTVFGWGLNVRKHTKAGTVRNFPLQANGAEILRLACCLLADRGVRVCAPVHDAVLIESPVGEIEGAVEACRGAMGEAGEVVLGGFRLRTDVRVVHHPNRYVDERGAGFWDWALKATCPMRVHDLGP